MKSPIKPRLKPGRSGSLFRSVLLLGLPAMAGAIALLRTGFAVRSQALTSSDVQVFPLSRTHGSGEASGGVLARATTEWTALSDAGWLVITAGQSGSGHGTIEYTISAAGILVREFGITQNGLTPHLEVSERRPRSIRRWQRRCMRPPSFSMPGLTRIEFWEGEGNCPAKSQHICLSARTRIARIR